MSRALGVYVHVPFCMRRCGYCAFATVAVGERLDPDTAERYVTAVEGELAMVAPSPRRAGGAGDTGGPAVSLSFGGGTPTMLEPAHVERLIGAVRDHLGLDPDAEIAIEANPDGLRPGQLAALAGLGVTRISFGLQSVRRHVLEVLDRTHDPDAALAAVAEARRVGFRHISLDLIHGTPGESDADWAATLDAAIASGVDHVSAYALSIEPGTRLDGRVRRGELPGPRDADAARRYLMAEQRLSAAGFEWYELSNWARSPASRSRHNLVYWLNDDWLGLGPGAHSHLHGHRWWNHRSTTEWQRCIDRGTRPVGGEERTSCEQRRIEDLMLGLRLARGVDPGSVDARALAELRADGLVDLVGDEDGNEEGAGPHGRVALTLEGRLFADLALRRLLG